MTCSYLLPTSTSPTLSEQVNPQGTMEQIIFNPHFEGPLP